MCVLCVLCAITRRSPVRELHMRELIWRSRIRELAGPQFSHGSVSTVPTPIPVSAAYVAPACGWALVNSSSVPRRTVRSNTHERPRTIICMMIMLSIGTKCKRRRAQTLSSGCWINGPELVLRRADGGRGDGFCRRFFENNAWPGCLSKQVARKKYVFGANTGRERIRTVSSEAFSRSSMFDNRHNSSAGSCGRISKMISFDSTDKAGVYTSGREVRSWKKIMLL